MDNKKVDIGIHISSDLDPKGFKEANDYMDKASKKGGQAGKGVQNSMKGAQNAASQAGEAVSAMFSNMGAAGAAAATKIRTVFAAISSALGGFGLLAAISAFITLASKVKDAWNELSTSVEDAAKKLKERWEHLDKQKENETARTRILEGLESEKKKHEEILALMKEKASFQAQMRELEARRNGDNLAADKAAIEGSFARGEITKAEYTKKVRELEDKARKQKQESESAPIQEEAERTSAALKYAAEQETSARNALLAFQKKRAKVTDEKHRGDTDEGFAKSLREAGELLTDTKQKYYSNRANIDKYAPSAAADFQRIIGKKTKFIQDAAAAMHVDPFTLDSEGKIVEKDTATLIEETIKAAEEQRQKLIDAKSEATDQYNKAAREAEEAEEKKTALDEAHKAEDTRVAKQREQEDETNAYVAGKEVKKLAKETETADQQRDRQRQREQLSDAKTKADTEKKEADLAVEESVELVRGWWETNREALEKEAKENETGPQAGLYKQAEKLFQGMNGNADPSKVAMLASFLEHSDFGDANLRRGVNGLMEAQGRREQAKGDVDTVAAADKAAREVDTAMQEQGQQQTLVDQFTASLKEIIDNKTATKGNDETYKQLAELARQAFADGQLTADESGRLTEALGRLSDASGEQGQAFINLVQKAVAGINAAAARSDELKGRIASLEKQINEAQRKLAKKE